MRSGQSPDRDHLDTVGSAVCEPRGRDAQPCRSTGSALVDVADERHEGGCPGRARGILTSNAPRRPSGDVTAMSASWWSWTRSKGERSPVWALAQGDAVGAGDRGSLAARVATTLPKTPMPWTDCQPAKGVGGPVTSQGWAVPFSRVSRAVRGARGLVRPSGVRGTTVRQEHQP